MLIKNYGHQEAYDNDLPYWYFWAFYATTEESREYMEWFKVNLPEATVCPRFNSGNPMIETSIYTEEDLTLFKLTWGHLWC
jgi:hypothetical protein